MAQEIADFTPCAHCNGSGRIKTDRLFTVNQMTDRSAFLSRKCSACDGLGEAVI